MIRKVHCLLAAVITLSFAPLAQAQLGIYGTVSVQRMSGIVGSPVTTAGVAYNDTVDPLGGHRRNLLRLQELSARSGSVGTFAAPSSPLTAARLADSNGAGARINSGLGGVRASFRTPLPYLKPYLEAAVGIGRSNYGVLTGNTGVELRNNFEYHLYGGLDLSGCSPLWTSA